MPDVMPYLLYYSKLYAGNGDYYHIPCKSSFQQRHPLSLGIPAAAGDAVQVLAEITPRLNAIIKRISKMKY